MQGLATIIEHQDPAQFATMRFCDIGSVLSSQGYPFGNQLVQHLIVQYGQDDIYFILTRCRSAWTISYRGSSKEDNNSQLLNAIEHYTKGGMRQIRPPYLAITQKGSIPTAIFGFQKNGVETRCLVDLKPRLIKR